MIAGLLQGTLEQGVIFLPFALGVYFSFQVLKTTDMTVDGSYVMGGGVFARLVVEGVNPWLAGVIGVIMAGMCGIGVGMIIRVGRLPALIAGILMLFMLYSINLKLYGMPNISLLGEETIGGGLWRLGLGVLGIMVGVVMLLRGRVGLWYRGFGVSEGLVGKLGGKAGLLQLSGLFISNGLAGVGGIYAVEVNRFADVNMGLGMALTGIGTVVIGRQLMVRLGLGDVFSAWKEVGFVVVGVMFYFLMMNVFLAFGVDPTSLKLILGLVLVVALSGRGVVRG